MTSVGVPSFLDADRLFDGDFIEGIHGHLDIGDVHAAAVRLHADFDVVVYDPFDGYEKFHANSALTSYPSNMLHCSAGSTHLMV